jgi:hypothetical protein
MALRRFSYAIPAAFALRRPKSPQPCVRCQRDGRSSPPHLSPVACSCPQRTAADAQTPFSSPSSASQTLMTAASIDLSPLLSPVPLVLYWDYHYQRKWRGGKYAVVPGRVPARSHAHLVLAASLLVLKTVSRTTCGYEATSFWSSSCLARFFCLVRRAYRLHANSKLRVADVWRRMTMRTRMSQRPPSN